MTDQFNPEQYTKYEKARILGARALQISANAPILIKISKEELEKLNYDPIKIAELEFEAGILPITVKRPLPKKTEVKIEEPIIEIIKEEKEIPKEKVKAEEIAPEEKAKVEEAEEIEAEAEEAEMSEEEVIEELGKEESEEEV